MSHIIGFVKGADVYLIISLIIFLTVFVLAALYMFTMSRATVEKLSNLPLTENEKNEKV